MDLRKLDIACFVLVVLLTGIGIYMNYDYGVRKQELIRKENDLLMKGLKDLNMAETSLRQFKDALRVTERELRLLDARIPASSEMGAFLKEIDSLLKEKGIALISIQPMPSVEDRAYLKLPVRMVFRGSYPNIFILLKELETSTRLAIMEKMVISRIPDTGECQVDLTANLFQRKI